MQKGSISKMKINSDVFVFILCVSLSGIVRCQEATCTKFEYDERTLSKLLAVEARLNQIEDNVKRLIDDVKQAPNEYLQQCKDMVDAATENVVKIPPLETDDWKLIFRATAGNGDSVLDAWLNGTSVTTTKPTNMRRSNSKHYADLNFMNEWDMRTLHPRQVKVALFHNEMEVAIIVFAPDWYHSLTRDTWFDRRHRIKSNWYSLNQRRNTNTVSVSLDAHPSRTFSIMTNDGGCEKDAGYFFVNDVYDGDRCDWGLGGISYPQFMFSTFDGPTIWGKGMYGLADYMAIYVTSNRY